MNTNMVNRQRGAVLIVALIFLVILTMLGVTAMMGTTMEFRMSGNTRDLAIALHAAEAAVRDAENDIQGKTYAGNTGLVRAPSPLPADYGVAGALGTCNVTAPFIGLCRPRTDPSGLNQMLPQDLLGLGMSMTASPSVAYGTYTGSLALNGVALQPRYLVEQFCQLTRPDASIGAKAGSPCKYYRITARGYGANPNSVMTVSEVFTIP